MKITGLLTTTGATALALCATVAPHQAQAEECLLDSYNDNRAGGIGGDYGERADTDGSARSGGLATPRAGLESGDERVGEPGYDESNDGNTACGTVSVALVDDVGDIMPFASRLAGLGGTNVLTQGATALGARSVAYGYDTVAIGFLAIAAADGATEGSYSNVIGATAIGARSRAAAAYATAIGNGSLAPESRSSAFGSGARALSENATALGPSARVSGNSFGAVSIGSYAEVFGDSTAAIALGNNADAAGLGAIAIGGAISSRASDRTRAFGARALAIGNNARATQTEGVALGTNASVSVAAAVAIGAHSRADEANTVSFGRAFDDNGTPDDTSDDTAAITRRLVNVADGTADSDAATVGQLNAALASAGSDFDPFSAGDNTAGRADASVIGANAVAIGAGSVAAEDDVVSFGRASDDNGTPGDPGDDTAAITRRLVNLADGIDASDAATKGQLDSAIAGVSGSATASQARADDAFALATTANGKADDNATTIATNATSISDNASAIAVNSGRIDTIDARSNSVAIGAGSSAASAAGTQGTALGSAAAASGEESTSLGAATEAAGLRSTAIGRGAFADGVQTSAIGTGASAIGVGATAGGGFATARSNFSTALGYASFAPAERATAIGNGAQAVNQNATAIGRAALARNVSATAIGHTATSDFARSTAIGYAAVTTAADQVTIGGAGSAVRIGDLDASTDAQQGPVDVVTVDVNGVLGRQQVATAASVDAVRANVDQIAAVSDAQFQALSSDVLTLSGRLDTVEFALKDLDQRMRGGVAAAMAMGGTMVVPDSTFSVSLNAATHQGEQGYSAAITARVAPRIYVSGALGGNTSEDAPSGRVGVAFGF